MSKIEHSCPPVRRDNPRALASGLSTCGQTLLYLTCSMIPSVDLARYGIYLAKNLGILECAKKINIYNLVIYLYVFFGAY